MLACSAAFTLAVGTSSVVTQELVDAIHASGARWDATADPAENKFVEMELHDVRVLRDCLTGAFCEHLLVSHLLGT